MDNDALEDLTADCPCGGLEWCLPKEILRSSRFITRQVLQIGLVYYYRIDASKKAGYDIGHERAFTEFIENFGKEFARIYREGMKIGQLHLSVLKKPIPSYKEIKEFFETYLKHR